MNFDPENPFPGLDIKNPGDVQAFFDLETNHMPVDAHSYANNADNAIQRSNACAQFKEFLYAANCHLSVPFLATSYYDSFISSHVIPEVIHNGASENVKLFVLSCFILAWKMIQPDQSDTPAFLIKIESPFLRTNINAMESTVDIWLQHRQCKRAITSLAFLDFFISTVAGVNDGRFPLIKNYATHRAYGQQQSIEYTLFKPSVLAASAIIYSCGKFYEKHYELFAKSICESGHIEPNRLREALGVTAKPIVVQPPALNDDDYGYDVDDNHDVDDGSDDDDEMPPDDDAPSSSSHTQLSGDKEPTDDAPRSLPRTQLFPLKSWRGAPRSSLTRTQLSPLKSWRGAPRSSLPRTQLFPRKSSRGAPRSSFTRIPLFRDDEPRDELARSFPCSRPLRDAAPRSSPQASFYHDIEAVNHVVSSSRPRLPLRRDSEPTGAALHSSSCGAAQNVVQGTSSNSSAANPATPRRLRFTLRGKAINPISSEEQAAAAAAEENRRKHDTTDSSTNNCPPKKRRFTH